MAERIKTISAALERSTLTAPVSVDALILSLFLSVFVPSHIQFLPVNSVFGDSSMISGVVVVS